MVDMTHETHETHETSETPETGGGTAVLPAPPRVRQLPPWRVLLHNDDVSDMVQVVLAIQELTAVSREEAMLRMLEAHTAPIANEPSCSRSSFRPSFSR
jgi:ATP-dependent Clp protease adapter protein ClpS